MPLGSRLKAAETRLETIIDTGTGSTVTVDRGHPGEHLTREHVWIDRIRWTERPKSLDGPQNRRRQQLTVTIFVRVVQEGDDAGAIRDRAYDLADEVEEALRADENLNGAVDFGGVTFGESDSFTDVDGRVCAIQLDAEYTATKSP